MNDMGCFSGLLTGYVSGKEGVEAIGQVARELKAKHGVLWLLDPVMGDEERGLYVSDDIVPVYRQLVSDADIITPNQFELELLSETKIDSIDSLKLAFTKLHNVGVENIVVTTFREKRSVDTITVVGSHRTQGAFAIDVPYYDRPYQGTGDLFAALLIGYVLKNFDLRRAVEVVLSTMQPILELTGTTFDARMQGANWRMERKRGRGAFVSAACELRLVESVRNILEPKLLYKARSV